jgi:hypothetical protein
MVLNGITVRGSIVETRLDGPPPGRGQTRGVHLKWWNSNPEAGEG